ncbi:hypothetical protein WAI453_001896 [Rhynchosporium graminicola]
MNGFAILNISINQVACRSASSFSCLLPSLSSPRRRLLDSWGDCRLKLSNDASESFVPVARNKILWWTLPMPCHAALRLPLTHRLRVAFPHPRQRNV